MMFYEYYQFTIANNKQALNKLLEHLNKPNPSKLFKKKDVKANIGYIDKNQVVIIKKNY